MGTQIVFVGELVGTALHAYGLDLRAGREGVVQNAAVLQILQLRADECGTLAGFYVLEVHDLKGLAVQLNAHSDFDISGSCHSYVF